MKSNKKQCIGIIGHFAFGHQFLDGQTVKTKILYDGIKKAYDSDEHKKAKIYCVDTYDNKSNKFRLILKTFFCLFKCKTIIILLSRNGRKIYFPLMYFAQKILRKKVFHDVIGGGLAGYVEKFPKYKTYLNAFEENWVEFEELKENLETLGITNCRVIPNFKDLNMQSAHINIPEECQKSFCMFSRVIEEKGITDAILAVNKYNELYNDNIKLNIWGPIDENYKDKFESLLKQYQPCVTYNGTVNYDRSVETLTDHLALLFPTFWVGEGFPGTIVDAYASGIPVIASDWRANRELIDNFSTGIVYPNPQTSNLYESIQWAMTHQKEMLEMRTNCIEKAKEYMTENWIPFIINIINK